MSVGCTELDFALMQAQPSLDAASDSFVRTVTWIGAAPAVLIALVLAVLVHPLVGIAVGVLAALAWVVAVRARLASAADRVVSGLDAAPVDPQQHPRLANLLEGLGATSGVTDPTVLLVRSDAMNAMVAVSGERVDVVLTSALVERLGRLELEGVLANLLGRVKDGSARYATTVLAVLGHSGRARRLLSQHLGEQRAVMSDLAAVDLTRYPPGLIAALSAMEDRGTTLSVPAVTAPLWIAPVSGVDPARDTGERQPLALRIAVLSEL